MSGPIVKMRVIEPESITMTVKEGIGSIRLDHYAGTCDIIPTFEDQVLSTHDKYVDTDIIVEKIPIIEVENDTGITVIIGGTSDVSE